MLIPEEQKLAVSDGASSLILPPHFTQACAQWSSLNGISQTPTANPAQLLIKSKPFCIIDLFPSKNGPRVTRIVSRSKRSWPTSAVNHKLPLNQRDPLVHQTSALPLRPESNRRLGFSFLQPQQARPSITAPLPHTPLEGGLVYEHNDVECNKKALNQVEEQRDPTRSHNQSGQDEKMEVKQNTNAYNSTPLNDNGRDGFRLMFVQFHLCMVLHQLRQFKPSQ